MFETVQLDYQRPEARPGPQLINGFLSDVFRRIKERQGHDVRITVALNHYLASHPARHGPVRPNGLMKRNEKRHEETPRLLF